MIRALSPRPGPIGISPPPVTAFHHPGSSTSTSTPPRPARQKTEATTVQVLRQGSRGAEVEKLQRLLNLRSQPSPSLKVDGIFGSVTVQTLQQYQRGVSIAADGVVGKQTWYHLLKGDKVTVPQPPTRPIQPSTTGSGVAAKSQTPPPVASLRALSTQVTGIWEWPLEKKFAEALRRTAPKLPSSMRHEFDALLSPKNLGIMAGSLVVWAGSHAFGVGEVVDVVLLIGGAVFLGMAVFDVAQDLGDFLVVTSTAAIEQDFDEASSHLARAIAILGVAAFVALLAKVARGRGGSKGATAEAPPKPAPELSTPQPRRSRPAAPTAEPSPPQSTQAPAEANAQPQIRSE
nr:peptidoglycan-binding protein [uncultured Thiodictyon sp.]